MPIAPPPDVRPAAACGFRRLVSARRHRTFSNQSVKNIRNSDPTAYSLDQLAQRRPPASTPAASSASASAIASTTGSVATSPASIAASRTSKAPTSSRRRPTALLQWPGQLQRPASRSWLVLANAYVDLGTWWCVTPFIGAGVGTLARQHLELHATPASLQLTNLPFVGGPPVASYASATSGSKWNFAWAAHAGLAYQVNPQLTLELAYSYVDLGSGRPAAITTSTASPRATSSSSRTSPRTT